MQELINKYGNESQKSCQYVYNNVTTLDDLILTNIAFLKGELYSTPYYCDGHVADETLPLIPDLININKFGFISTCGQPACIKHEFRHGHSFNDDNLIDFWFDYEQKPFIEGFILNKNLPDFINFVKNNEDYHVYIYDISNIICDDGASRQHSRRLTSSVDDIQDIILDTFNYDGRYIVSRSKEYKIISDKENAKWHNQTGINKEVGENRYCDNFANNEFYGYENIIALLKKNTAYVAIAWNDYGKGSTEKLLLQFFQQTQ